MGEDVSDAASPAGSPNFVQRRRGASASEECTDSAHVDGPDIGFEDLVRRSNVTSVSSCMYPAAGQSISQRSPMEPASVPASVPASEIAEMSQTGGREASE